MILKIISSINHPALGEIKRKTAYGFSHDPFLQEIKIFGQIYHYKDVVMPVLGSGQGETSIQELRQPLIKDQYFELIANNTTMVDPASGNYVSSDTEGAIGEYDYFVLLAKSGMVDIFTLQESAINRADLQYNRLNFYL